MKTKNLLKLRSVLLILVFVVVVGAGLWLLVLSRLSQNKTIPPNDDLFGWKYPSVKFPITGIDQLAYSDIRDPGGIPEGLPIRLKIPVIGVDAAIEDALITPDGRMDVPAGTVNVAWFALGPHPGEVGSAVIGGHFGIDNGVPRVFYDLDKLKVGDKIYILDDKGNSLAFIVRKIELFDRNADATSVFTSSDGLAHLNLITCEGIWNQVNGAYPQRRVVFTDAVSAEDTAVPEFGRSLSAEAKAIFTRMLSIGMRGVDVSALQTALEEKGFLVMPRGIAKGYFGALTRTAVAKYQTSVGLSPTGKFNSLTINKFISEQDVAGVKPKLPSTDIVVPDLSRQPASKTFIGSLKTLYSNQIDGLVTSALLILIFFTVFKIIKRK